MHSHFRRGEERESPSAPSLTSFPPSSSRGMTSATRPSFFASRRRLLILSAAAAAILIVILVPVLSSHPHPHPQQPLPLLQQPPPPLHLFPSRICPQTPSLTTRLEAAISPMLTFKSSLETVRASPLQVFTTSVISTHSSPNPIPPTGGRAKVATSCCCAKRRTATTLATMPGRARSSSTPVRPTSVPSWPRLSMAGSTSVLQRASMPSNQTTWTPSPGPTIF
ncbi:hypothetical protein BKA62DRAFT_353994 [Auriculariales sp. MPI-PUGE-AT-0066]|nr:hypothetical protein BKA62DRAFT_353994 [Auriculariales sp. MPI-PUGE-AT-0066]